MTAILQKQYFVVSLFYRKSQQMSFLHVRMAPDDRLFLRPEGEVLGPSSRVPIIGDIVKIADVVGGTHMWVESHLPISVWNPNGRRHKSDCFGNETKDTW